MDISGQIRKRESEKLGQLRLGKLEPHVGIVGLKSNMLDSREIGVEEGRACIVILL